MMPNTKNCFIGLGGAGISMVQLAYPDIVGIDEILLIDTTESFDFKNANFRKLLIGPKKLKGKGAGRDPGAGDLAVDESWQEIYSATSEYDHIIIVAGAAGGTGGAAPHLAEKIKQSGKSVDICLSSALCLESSSIRKSAEKIIAKTEMIAAMPSELFVFYPDKTTHFPPHHSFVDSLNRFGRQIMKEVAAYYF